MVQHLQSSWKIFLIAGLVVTNSALTGTGQENQDGLATPDAQRKKLGDQLPLLPICDPLIDPGCIPVTTSPGTGTTDQVRDGTLFIPNATTLSTKQIKILQNQKFGTGSNWIGSTGFGSLARP